MAIPTVDLQWATGVNAVKITEPTADQKNLGYQAGDYPTQGEFNYLFNGYYQWTEYLTNEVSGAIDDTNSISETFVYLDDTDYGNISEPTANDKINKKVSASQDISIQSTAVGIIEGLDYNIDSKTITVDSGMCYLYKSFSTTWDTPVLKNKQLSQSTYNIVNAGLTDWEYVGSGGIVAPSVAAFAPAVTIYVFILANTFNSNVSILADTSSNGSAAINYYSINNGNIGTDIIFIRRIAVSTVGNNNELLNCSHKGNYTSVRTSSPVSNLQAGINTLVDSAGTFIAPTAALLTGNNVVVNLQNMSLTPNLSQSTIDATVSFNGTATNRHTLKVIGHISGTGLVSVESYSGYSTNVISNSSGQLIDANSFSVSVSNSTLTIQNISTGAAPGSNILYLDIRINGWTDYREQFKIG